jgi:two-component system NtrC family sensor kinase
VRLSARFFISIFSLILILGIASAILGFFIIQTDIVARSQEDVSQNFNGFRLFYENEIEQIGLILRLIKSDESLDALKNEIGLDYLEITRSPENHPSPLVRKAGLGQKGGGTRVMKKDELHAVSPQLAEKAMIPIVTTDQARPARKQLLEDALVIEYALPLSYTGNRVESVLYGGKMLNNNITLLDKLHNMVLGDELYDGKPLGTATIFLDDVRVTTNVLDTAKNRAIGTLVSGEVYRKVIEKGETWRDRAFVVNDWYLTAYQPLIDPGGERIGILYVGKLEQPFFDMTVRALLFFSAIVVGVAILGALVTFVLVRSISRPILGLIQATKAVGRGRYTHAINWVPKVHELAWLASAFNSMSTELGNRETSLNVKSEKLTELNRSYLDLISFVSHELKGILSSTILNAYTVRDGFLGMINFKQRKALDSITRNLDYLAETVKNFMNLSRIEKSELELRKRMINLKSDIFDFAIESFEKAIEERQMTVLSDIPADLAVEIDPDLFLVVANNLIGNALKYGYAKGKIEISVKTDAELIEVDVYNDGDPLTEAERERLFGKFSRLDDAKKKHIKGTGLGLFITKEIIANHGGTIRCESRPEGNSFIFSFLRRNNVKTA